MVFAVAALILQLAPAAKLIADAKTIAAAMDTRAEISTAASGDSLAEKTGDKADKHSETPALPPSFSAVRLASDPTESASSSKLTAMSLGNSEDTRSLSTIRIPSVPPAKPVEVIPVEKRRPTRTWWILTIAQHGAAAFDAYSTRQAIGRGAVEDDPLMRPFAHSSAIYVASQVSPVLLDFLSRRMMRSENPVFRRMWWAPQSGATAMFIFSGVHNLGVASRQ